MTRAAPRFARLIVSAFAFSVVSTAALASDLPSSDKSPAVVAADASGTAAAPAHRLTTAERWRGRPYLHTSEGELLRSEALDKRLPPAQPPFTSGFGLNTAGSEVLRSHALDRNIPMAVPGLVNSF